MSNEHGGVGHWYQKVRYQWQSGGPVITWAIVIACAAVWLVEVLLKYISPSLFANVIFNGSFTSGLSLVKPWMWFTSMFMHDPNVLHVLGNMLTLIAIGPYLEGLLGHWCFLAVYTVCGLGASEGLIVYSHFTNNWATSAYGASGALFGLFAVMLLVFRRTHTDIRAMVVWIVVDLAMPLFVPHVAWQAHVGGFITGLLLTWLLLDGVPALRRRPLWVRMLVYGGIIVVVLIVLAVLLTPQWLMQLLRQTGQLDSSVFV